MGFSITRSLIKLAVAWLPRSQRERFGEEWQSHVNEVPGKVGKLLCCVGFLFAAYNMALTMERKQETVKAIQPPDLETKVAISQKKAERLEITLEQLKAAIPADVALYVAQNTPSNVREVVLDWLVVYFGVRGAEITLPYAKQVLKFYGLAPRKVWRKAGFSLGLITIESIRKMVRRAGMRVFPKPGRRKRP